MKLQKLFSAICGMAVLAMIGSPANAQMNDQAAREQAREAVRARLHLEAGKFLQVQRQEALEQLLAGVVARPSWAEFIYKVSEEGDEIKERAVVHHIVTDGDPTFTFAINPASGSLYRIQGFPDSLAELNKLTTEANVRVSGPDQAEAVANFYRAVNPQRRSLTALASLLEFKQAAEWQCQAVPFDPDEKEFEAWWKHAKPLHKTASFQQTAVRFDGGYAVEWIVLSSPGVGFCGGAALRARLGVGSNGGVGEITFIPLEAPAGRR
jgi:hypothetical protein